ncbi:MAG: hypothetical protein CL878_15060, partial [Dehalococcoidia bacterium]|nr:hypothetical protein [Dehalococcoidia bacterium]
SKRQQQLLLALRDQFMSSDILPRLPSLAQQLSDTVSTDFPLTKVPSLAMLGMSIPDDSISRIAINYDQGMVVSAVTETGADVLIPDLLQIRRIVHRAINGYGEMTGDEAAPLAEAAAAS